MCYFRVHGCTREQTNALLNTPKTLAHTFLPSFDNANGHLCQERFLRSRNCATIITGRHISPLFSSDSGGWGKGGGRCLQGNLWYSPPASMTSRLTSVRMASKVFIEETDKNFDFITEMLRF